MQIFESNLRLVVRGILRESTGGSSLLHPGVTVQDLARDWVQLGDSYGRTPIFSIPRSREQVRSTAKEFNIAKYESVPVPEQVLEQFVDLYMALQNIVPSLSGNGTYDSAYKDAARALRARLPRDGFDYFPDIYGPYNPQPTLILGTICQSITSGVVPQPYQIEALAWTLRELKRITPEVLDKRFRYFDTSKKMAELAKMLTPEEINSMRPTFTKLFNPGEAAGLTKFYEAYDLLLSMTSGRA